MFMKWLIRLAFPALGILLMLIFFGLKDPIEPTAEEEPATATMENIPDFEGLVPPTVPTDGPDIVFKWQDRDGSWHYADSPPQSGHWNALAIERAEEPVRARPDPANDWQSPYSAPFSMASPPRNTGS